MAHRATARFAASRLAALALAFVLLAVAQTALADTDSTPPSLHVYSPSEGATLLDDRVIVFGATERGALVTVNGILAEVNVFDGTFEVRDLSLARSGTGCLQPATLTVVARDGAGNVATLTRALTANHCVTHPTLASPVPSLSLASGQTTPLSIDFADYFADDGGARLLTFSTFVSGPGAGALSATYGPGALSFSWANPTFAGSATLTVTARDRSGEVSDPVAVSLTVLAGPSANQPPVVQIAGAPDALPVSGAVTLLVTASDPDGETLAVSAEGASAGISVLSVERVDATHFAVRVGAQAGALIDAQARVVVTAVDPHFAGASAVATLLVYDPAAPMGLALEAPTLPEILPSQFEAGPQGGSGIYVEIGAARRIGHLYTTDPSTEVVPREAEVQNGEHTYFRLFVTLPTAPGIYRQTVWAVDAGLAPEPFSFDVTVLEALPAPRIDRLTPVAGDLSLVEGEPLVLQWVGAVSDPAHTSFEWAVDGEVVARTSGLSGVVLEPGTHTVTLTATSPGGGSSSSTTVTVSPASASTLPTRGVPWYWWVGLAGIVVVGLVLGGTEIGIYFLLAGLVGAVIDRQNREKLLTHFVRGRIYQIIEYEPGVHLSELQRKAGVARGVCAYHLHALEKAGLVKTTRDGMYLRFYATKVKIDAEAYTLAAEDREVLRAIEGRPGITEREVSDLIGKNATQVARSVKALAQSGHVEARRQGEAVQLFPRTQRGTAAGQAAEL